jgi:hypothetical protein
VMKAKTARLEIKRQLQAVRAKEVAAEKAAHVEYLVHRFEEKKAIREQEQAKLTARRLQILDALKSDSKEWIDESNLSKQLGEEVFVFTPPSASNDSSTSSLGALSWLERLKSMKPPSVEDDLDGTK